MMLIQFVDSKNCLSFPFSLVFFFLKTLLCLIVVWPIRSFRFLFLLFVESCYEWDGPVLYSCPFGKQLFTCFVSSFAELVFYMMF